MKLTVTIEDTDPAGEGVKINSTPDFKTLLRMKKDAGREYTTAVQYAIVAVASMIKLSKQITKDKVKAKFDAGLIPAVPSTRNMFS